VVELGGSVAGTGGAELHNQVVSVGGDSGTVFVQLDLDGHVGTRRLPRLGIIGQLERCQRLVDGHLGTPVG
jgi:hypothetical protein